MTPQQITHELSTQILKMMLTSSHFCIRNFDTETILDLHKLSISDRFKIALWWLTGIMSSPEFGTDLRDVLLLQEFLDKVVSPEECCELGLRIRSKLVYRERSETFQ